eukprot:g13385.t1
MGSAQHLQVYRVLSGRRARLSLNEGSLELTIKIKGTIAKVTTIMISSIIEVKLEGSVCGPGCGPVNRNPRSASSAQG